MIYFDYAATTPCDPKVFQAMTPYFCDIFGNPASRHGLGQEAEAAVEAVREGAARFLGADAAEIVFTGGGTESNNTAIKGVVQARRSRGNHIITSCIEHHAVIAPCRFLEREGFQVTYLPVGGDGLVDPDAVRRAITNRTVLISVMHGNNEIGTIQPIAEIGIIAREHEIPFHVDAVQTFGHWPCRVEDLQVDLLSASAHKLYGPKGVGLLYARKGTAFAPLLLGGDQEGKRRASTHNVPGIAGFGKALELARDAQAGEIRDLTLLRDRMIGGILAGIDGATLNGHRQRRLPNNVHVSLAGVEGQGVQLSLDLLGIACSTGSACSSLAVEPSHVLMAIGLPRHLAHGSIRLSLGRPTTAAEVEHLLAVLPKVVQRLRSVAGKASQ